MTGCVQKNKRQNQLEALAVDTAAVISEGQEISKAAFKTLSSNLKEAMGEGGVAHAVQFCNVEAMPLTDSLSSHFGVQVRRASHRPRNPDNRADSLELATIKKYLSQIKQGTEPEPSIYATQKRIEYYAPIRIDNELCLNCHGEPGMDITEENLATIRKLYPKDEATGFEFGELRGIWSITFPRNYFDKDGE